MSLLDSPAPQQHTRNERRRPPRRPSNIRPALHIVPGYTVLVIDTNILLSSLPQFIKLVESQQWTIVIPLAVITEMDGLSSNKTELGTASAAAITFISSHMRSHAICMKVQTSKGNYLSNLNVRSEDVQFEMDEATWERNMDDLILRSAIWQDEHWINRSKLLSNPPADIGESGAAAKVVLLSFDRNCKLLLVHSHQLLLTNRLLSVRLKARARQLDVADQKELASILSFDSNGSQHIFP